MSQDEIPTLVPPPPETTGLAVLVRELLEEIREEDERPTLIPEVNDEHTTKAR
jgi:hypothetical protein